MNRTIGMIDITGCDPRALIRAAYRLSSPRGLGFFAAKPGELDDATIDAIIARGERGISMDYVNGRSVKFHVVIVDGRWFVGRDWYDHTQSELEALMEAIGKPRSLVAEVKARHAVALEQDVVDALGALRAAGGTIVDDMDTPHPAVAAHMDGFWEARERGLVTESYSYPKTTWAIVAELEQAG